MVFCGPKNPVLFPFGRLAEITMLIQAWQRCWHFIRNQKTRYEAVTQTLIVHGDPAGAEFNLVDDDAHGASVLGKI